jgi:hypothetical protein
MSEQSRPREAGYGPSVLPTNVCKNQLGFGTTKGTAERAGRETRRPLQPKSKRENSFRPVVG